MLALDTCATFQLGQVSHLAEGITARSVGSFETMLETDGVTFFLS